MADDCSEVLRNGTYKNIQFGRSTAVDLVLMKRFASSDFQKSKQDTTLGFGVPIGQFFLSGDYTNDEYEERKSQINSLLDFGYARRDETHLLVSSGDEQILGAWLQCMQSNGPRLLAYPTINSARSATITLQFIGAGGISEGVLSEDVSKQIPEGVSIVGGADSLTKGAKIGNGKQTVNLRFESYLIPLALTFNLSQPVGGQAIDSAEVYIPPRIKALPERKTRTAQHSFWAPAPKGHRVETLVVEITQDEYNREGWRWEGVPAVSCDHLDGIANNSHLDGAPTKTPMRIEQKYAIHTLADGDAAGARCTLSATMKRWVWVSA